MEIEELVSVVREEADNILDVILSAESGLGGDVIAKLYGIRSRLLEALKQVEVD